MDMIQILNFIINLKLSIRKNLERQWEIILNNIHRQKRVMNLNQIILIQIKTNIKILLKIITK